RGMAKADRRQFVIDQLKTFALSEQQGPIKSLETQVTAGHVEAVRALWIFNVIRCQADAAAIAELAGQADIAEIRYDPLRQVLLGGPNEISRSARNKKNKAMTRGPTRSGDDDEINDIAWGVTHINADQVWNELGIHGQGAIVAVLDTGVDYNHTDLQDHIWQNEDEIPDNDIDDDNNGYVDDIRGYDFAYIDNDPMDGDGHGTHCSGTVAGDGSAGTETGVAPEATVMAVKVLTDSGSGEEFGVWEAMQYAVDNGADVISMSLGWMHAWGPDRSQWRQFCDIVQAAGTVMIIAAGNERDSGYIPPDNIRTPGDVPDVVTIGATDSSDEIAYFSSYGPVSWDDIPPYLDYPYPPGLTKPDVSAPGVNINSLVVGGGYSGNTWSGTSMATPHVAGIAALLFSVNPGLLPADIKFILETSSLDLGPTGKDNDFGSGRVDAYQAVIFALNGLGFVEGTVTSANGDPLAAKIQVSNSSISVPTDENGYYRLGLAAGETYDLEASSFGYVTGTAQVTIIDGQTETVNFVLQPAAAGLVEGYVRNSETNDGIPGAVIQVPGTPLDPVTTDAAGFYQIDMPGDASYEFLATATGHLSQNETFFVPANQTTTHDFYLSPYPRLIVWDKDQSSASDADSIVQAIQNNGQEAFAVDNLLELGDLSYFNAIFICLGIYPYNYTFSANSAEENALIEYLNNGGRIFMEGGDVWAYDLQPAALKDYFHIDGISDGPYGGDAGMIFGEDNSFAEDMTFSYQGENNYIDRLATIGSSFEVLRNDNPSYYSGIAYIDNTSNYRTFGLSIEFGGLSTGAYPNNQTALMAAILEFFEIINSPPQPPQQLVVNQGSSQLLLNWQPPSASDLAGYYIYRSTDPGSFSETPLTTVGPVSYYLDENVQNGTTYYYYLTAFDEEGLVSDPSNIANGTPTEFPAPSNLNAGDGFDGYVPLTWNAPVTVFTTLIDEKTGQPFYVSDNPPLTLATLTGYTVYRSLTPGGPYGAIEQNIVSPAYVDFNVTNDMAYYYAVKANYTSPPGQSEYSNEDQGLPSSTPPVQYLVVDFDDNNSSCPDIESSLNALGFDGSYTTNLDSYSDLSNFTTVFVCLGIYPQNYRIETDSPEEQKLTDLLDRDGQLYLEGGDFWFWDYNMGDGQNLIPYFNIDGLNDGSPYGDTGPITGVLSSFLAGMYYNYNGENTWMDWITAESGAENILVNQSPAYFNGVANADASGYKTIGVSFEFGGLVNGDDSQQDLMEAYMEFFQSDIQPTVYPNPPYAVTAIGNNSQINLGWATPTHNTDGSPLTDLAGFKIYRSLSPGSYPSTPIATIGLVNSYQ
ncbi:MAG: S8 family serine peptidase, partial [Planctomycetes bacterium]|nr:S8 family serine peptidase [Planctomycetota bacterium]